MNSDKVRELIEAGKIECPFCRIPMNNEEKRAKESWETFLGISPITKRAVFEELRVLSRKFKPDDYVRVTVEKREPKIIQSERPPPGSHSRKGWA